MTGIHGHQCCRYELWSLSEKGSIARKTIVERDVILDLGVSLRNEQRREVLLVLRHEHICLKLFINAG
jgi:hypothetical protein